MSTRGNNKNGKRSTPIVRVVVLLSIFLGLKLAIAGLSGAPVTDLPGIFSSGLSGISVERVDQ